MPGEYADAETGFTYLRARYYDPTTGQFISRDPLTAMTQSPYGYVYDNPLNGTDPLGLFSLGKFVKDHWRGVATGLAIAAVVVAVAAVPVAGLGAWAVMTGGATTAEAFGTYAVASALGGLSTGLSAVQTKIVCDNGSSDACRWGKTTTTSSGGATILGFQLPFVGSLLGLGASIAGLLNPHYRCPRPGSNPSRNPDGSFISGGQSPGMDPAGVTRDPEYANL